jgi:hypothetical protein
MRRDCCLPKIVGANADQYTARPAVHNPAKSFEVASLIRYKRGNVTIVDRRGLQLDAGVAR